MTNLTKLSISGDGYKIFINIVDNRIEMILNSVNSINIRKIYEFIKEKQKFIKPDFTTIIDLTNFRPKDEKVNYEIEKVQELFKIIGWGNYARIKKDETENLHMIMKDGFFTSWSSGMEFLNEWRRKFSKN